MVSWWILAFGGSESLANVNSNRLAELSEIGISLLLKPFFIFVFFNTNYLGLNIYVIHERYETELGRTKYNTEQFHETQFIAAQIAQGGTFE